MLKLLHWPRELPLMRCKFQDTLIILSYIPRSESSPNNANELRRIKSFISDLQNNLEELRTQTDDKLNSMTSSITALQSQIAQLKKPLNWIMETLAAANNSQVSPPFIKSESSKFTF